MSTNQEQKPKLPRIALIAAATVAAIGVFGGSAFAAQQWSQSQPQIAQRFATGQQPGGPAQPDMQEFMDPQGPGAPCMPPGDAPQGGPQNGGPGRQGQPPQGGPQNGGPGQPPQGGPQNGGPRGPGQPGQPPQGGPQNGGPRGPGQPGQPPQGGPQNGGPRGPGQPGQPPQGGPQNGGPGGPGQQGQPPQGGPRGPGQQGQPPQGGPQNGGPGGPGQQGPAQQGNPQRGPGQPGQPPCGPMNPQGMIQSMTRAVGEAQTDLAYADGKMDTALVKTLISSATALSGTAAAQAGATNPITASQYARAADQTARAAHELMLVELGKDLPSMAGKPQPPAPPNGAVNDDRLKARVSRDLAGTYEQIVRAGNLAREAGNPETTALMTASQAIYKQAYDLYQAGNLDKAARVARSAQPLLGAVQALARLSIAPDAPVKVPAPNF